MALVNTGQISLKDVADEFSDAAPHSMSEFFGKGNAPASGETQLADFYGASAGPAVGDVSNGFWQWTGTHTTSNTGNWSQSANMANDPFVNSFVTSYNQSNLGTYSGMGGTGWNNARGMTGGWITWTLPAGYGPYCIKANMSGNGSVSVDGVNFGHIYMNGLPSSNSAGTLQALNLSNADTNTNAAPEINAHLARSFNVGHGGTNYINSASTTEIGVHSRVSRFWQSYFVYAHWTWNPTGTQTANTYDFNRRIIWGSMIQSGGGSVSYDVKFGVKRYA